MAIQIGSFSAMAWDEGNHGGRISFLAAFTERKQALHDLMCDTLVVDKHAFTAQPELQQEGLGAVTIIVLVLSGLLFVGMIVLIGIAVAALASGGWH